MLETQQAQPTLREADPEISQLIEEEERYQSESVRLIPSENYASRAVLEATGTVLANKYSEYFSVSITASLTVSELWKAFSVTFPVIRFLNFVWLIGFCACFLETCELSTS